MKKIPVFLVLLAALIMLCTGCTSKEVSEVVSGINGIGDVTLDSKDDIYSLYDKYDALTEEEKAKIKNIDVLEEAVKTYEKLAEAEAEKDIDAGDYKAASELFVDVEKYNTIAYEKASSCFQKEEFETAKSIFTDLGDYSDSSSQVEKCDYELSVNRSFIRALRDGLEKRWDYSDKGYQEEFEYNNVEELPGAEYMSYSKKCVQFELDEIEGYKDKKFEDEELGKVAAEYINLLTSSKDVIDYYMMDYDRYVKNWDRIYGERSLMIRDFVEKYGLEVDASHQTTMDGFLTNAKVADEQKKVESDVQEMLNNAVLEINDEEFSGYTIMAEIENTTDVTFEYFNIEIDFYNQEGTVINTEYFSSINDFTPGKKVQINTYASDVSDNYDLRADYYIKN